MMKKKADKSSKGLYLLNVGANHIFNVLHNTVWLTLYIYHGILLRVILHIRLIEFENQYIQGSLGMCQYWRYIYDQLFFFPSIALGHFSTGRYNDKEIHVQK